MYFHGTLSIDPSAPTEMERQMPTKAFRRLLHTMTLGLSTPQDEVETFGAVQILQQINRGLRAVGIDNVVRLAKDDQDVYLDEDGLQDDMQQAMSAFAAAQRGASMGLFEELTLVCEHHDDEFSYLVEVHVRRRHTVGEMPIEIVIDGVLPGWQRQTGEGRDALLARLRSEFEDEEALEAFLATREELFREFVHRLEAAVQVALPTDRIEVAVARRIVRANQVVTDDEESLRGDRKAQDPALQGYHGFQDHLFYLFLWPDFLGSQNYHCHSTQVVDPQGQVLFQVREDPVATAGSSAFQPGESMSIPDGAVVGGGVAPAGAIAAADTDGVSSGWLSGFGGSDVGDTSSISSCGSSCGASCGGGCGGCGG